MNEKNRKNEEIKENKVNKNIKDEFHFLHEKVIEKRNYGKLKKWLNVIFSGILLGLIACGVCLFLVWNIEKKNNELESAKGETLEEEKDVESQLNIDLDQWRGEVRKNFVRLNSQRNTKLGMILKKEKDLVYIVSEKLDNDENDKCDVAYGSKKIGTASLVKTDEKLGISMWVMETAKIEQTIYKKMKEASIPTKETCKEKDVVLVVSINEDNNVYYLLGKIKSTSVKLNMEDGIYHLYTTDISSFDGENGFAVDKEGNIIGMTSAVMENDKLGDTINIIKIQSIYKDIENLQEDKTRAILGIEGTSITKNDAYRFGDKVSYGVWVSKITEGSAAYRSGIMAGDIIVALDGYIILDMQGLKDTLLDYKGGDEVEIEFLREEKNGYKECREKVTLK